MAFFKVRSYLRFTEAAGTFPRQRQGKTFCCRSVAEVGEVADGVKSRWGGGAKSKSPTQKAFTIQKDEGAKENVEASYLAVHAEQHYVTKQQQSV